MSTATVRTTRPAYCSLMCILAFSLDLPWRYEISPGNIPRNRFSLSANASFLLPETAWSLPKRGSTFSPWTLLQSIRIQSWVLAQEAPRMESLRSHPSHLSDDWLLSRVLSAVLPVGAPTGVYIQHIVGDRGDAMPAYGFHLVYASLLLPESNIIDNNLHSRPGVPTFSHTSNCLGTMSPQDCS